MYTLGMGSWSDSLGLHVISTYLLTTLGFQGLYRETAFDTRIPGILLNILLFLDYSDKAHTYNATVFILIVYVHRSSFSVGIRESSIITRYFTILVGNRAKIV